MKHALKSLLLTFVVCSTASISHAQSLEGNARSVIDKYRPSLVVVSARCNIVTTTSGDPLPPNESMRRTLGIAVGDNGLIAISNSAIDSTVGLAGQEVQVDDKVVTVETAKTEFIKINSVRSAPIKR